MRHALLATASAVLLACLGACGNDSDAASDDAVVVEPAASASPTAADPYAWTDVAYADYLEAADQIGLRPDVLVPEAGFSSGLSVLCRTSAEELATMRSSYVEDVTDSGTYSTAKYLADEVGLRLGLACPQRMTDWTAAGLEQDDADTDTDADTDASEEGSSVTDDDLDRATAEEVAESSEPTTSPTPTGSDDDYDHDGSDDPDATPSAESDGTTAGNGDRQS